MKKNIQIKIHFENKYFDILKFLLWTTPHAKKRNIQILKETNYFSIQDKKNQRNVFFSLNQNLSLLTDNSVKCFKRNLVLTQKRGYIY